MNVQIVCSRLDAHRVLPLLAHSLADGTAWSLSSEPDERADVNYFLNYLEYSQLHPGWHKTPIAAWFTHKDEANAKKAKLWDAAAAEVDLRTVSAERYAEMLRSIGSTSIVRPAVDRHFRLAEKKRGKVPVVGISAFTYGDGRKGEQLVAGLMKAPLTKKIELKASGRGWEKYGVPTTYHRWSDVSAFVASLDVYLCTALVEGVPMPPLEAMATGVRCVMPRGVGLLDELPDLPDLYRYERGDLGDMMRALEEAASETRPVDRMALRDAVKQFSAENWARDHIEAFERAFGQVPAPAPSPPPAVRSCPSENDPSDWRGRAGVYYVAYGDPARACAVRAIDSFKRHMPGIPVALVSDRPLGPEDMLIHEAEVDIGARSAKVRIYDLAPAEWDHVLYLDADTEVTADISFLFQTLADGWEAVITKNPSRFHVAQHMTRPDNRDECAETFRLWGSDQMMQWNGGVFGFRRCDPVREFFSSWRSEWERYGKRDQAALLRALWSHPLRFYALGNEWNTVPNYMPKDRTAGILHYPQTARRWSGIVPERGDSPQAWARVRP